MRWFLLAFGALSAFVACSAEPEPQLRTPDCTPNQFRACESDLACHAVQQCYPPGLWGQCFCTIPITDAGDDSMADALAD